MMRIKPDLDEDQNILDYCALEEVFGAEDVFIDTADGRIERLHIPEVTAKLHKPDNRWKTPE